jgi:tetratricopeptide (TPR) repeat protein
MMRWLLVIAVLATPAWAQKSSKPEAQEHLAKAKAHFDLQEYVEAETELKAAYRVDPSPQILYAIAQAQRLRGDCELAVRTYQNFLRTDPPADQEKLAKDNIKTCEAQPKPKAEPPKPEAAKPEPPKPEPAKPEPPKPIVQETRTVGVPWSRDWAGHGLLVGGLAVGAAGAVVALRGQRAIDRINNAEFYDDFLARAGDGDRAKRERSLGLIGLGAGSALVATAVIVYWVRGPRTVVVGPREVAVAWRF